MPRIFQSSRHMPVSWKYVGRRPGYHASKQIEAQLSFLDMPILPAMIQFTKSWRWLTSASGLSLSKLMPCTPSLPALIFRESGMGADVTRGGPCSCCSIPASTYLTCGRVTADDLGVMLSTSKLGSASGSCSGHYAGKDRLSSVLEMAVTDA